MKRIVLNFKRENLRKREWGGGRRESILKGKRDRERERETEKKRGTVREKERGTVR